MCADAVHGAEKCGAAGCHESGVLYTLELLSKKRVNFGQGLDFLKFSEGSRGENEENR